VQTTHSNTPGVSYIEGKFFSYITYCSNAVVANTLCIQLGHVVVGFSRSMKVNMSTLNSQGKEVCLCAFYLFVGEMFSKHFPIVRCFHSELLLKRCMRENQT